MRNLLAAAATLVAVSTVVISAATIKDIRLAEGYDEVTTLTGPVVDNTGRPGVQISVTNAYDRKGKFVRKTGNLMTKGPEYDLDAKVDIGALLTQSLQKEATAMGFSQGAKGTPWLVTGALRQAYMESRQVYMGATLFYGFLDVELQIAPPSGATITKRLRVHTYTGDAFNGGFGRRDEAEASAAHLIVEGAQEILALLNRDVFKAPAHRGVKARFERAKAAGAEKAGADVRAVGLSGLPEAGPAFAIMLPGEPREFLRSRLINAIGMLGTRDAVAVLTNRYVKEDEDPRYYTLKALDYIGSPDAVAAITANGMADKDSGPKRLAGRILGKPAK